MYLRVLQRGRKTVRADEMFLRNKKPRTGAGFPLRRLLELLRCAIEFDCDRRLRGSFRARRLRREKPVPELDRAPPNGDGGNEKEQRRSHDRDAVVMRLNPVQHFCRGESLTTKLTANEHK